MIKRKTDLTGQKFGDWTALYPIKGENPNKSYTLCKCKCNIERIVWNASLKNGHSRSCGGCSRIIDLSGKTFGRWTVLGISHRDGKRLYWNVRCSCPEQTESAVLGFTLTNGESQSCGCLKSEILKSKVGPLSHSWKEELTDEHRINGRNFLGYDEWKLGVKERANFTCQICQDSTGGNLESHHLYSYDSYLDLRTNLDNGVCLCHDCHDKFHKLYGFGENTAEQFNEFLSILIHLTLKVYI